jgi:Periplasmic copper-binding protein (NosD)
VNIIKKFWFSFIIVPLFLLDASNVTTAQDSGIKEISENQFVDEFGYVHVLGEIQNALTSEIDFVKVNVAYYDSQNKIIGSDSVYSDPHTLGPGQSATYQALTASSNLASKDVSSIKVNYEYQVSGITYQSSGQGNRPVTSNTGQSSALGPDEPDCGKVVTGNFTLTADLVCNSKDGLIVGAHNTTINLNGYSITGPGVNSEKVGISIPHSENVVIQGSGSIRNYQAGILISGSQNTEVNRVTFEGNKIAIFMTGAIGTTIQQNFIDSNSIGVASHSTNGTQLHANMMTGNDLAGITFVNTDKSQIDTNAIGGSRNGIYLDSQSTKNTILYNKALKNDIDINNADGLPLTVNENELLNNICSVSNPDGLCNSQATN